MNDAFPYADLILLGMVAGFVLLRLRSILGQNTGFDGSTLPPPPQASSPSKREELIVQVANKLKMQQRDVKAEDKLLGGLNPASQQAVQAIVVADSQFLLDNFLTGARGAFEMVFDAFLKNDKVALEHLLAPDIAKTFIEEASNRTKGERITETTLVAIESADIQSVEYEEPIARITVRFVSEQITIVRDKTGKIIEGDPTHVERVEDEWTFERQITSRSPNWMVVDT